MKRSRKCQEKFLANFVAPDVAAAAATEIYPYRANQTDNSRGRTRKLRVIATRLCNVPLAQGDQTVLKLLPSGVKQGFTLRMRTRRPKEVILGLREFKRRILLFRRSDSKQPPAMWSQSKHRQRVQIADATLFTTNRPAPSTDLQKSSAALGLGIARNAANRSRIVASFFCMLFANSPFANS